MKRIVNWSEFFAQNPKVVNEALGHSSISITFDLYSRVLPNMQDELATAVVNLLKRDVTVE